LTLLASLGLGPARVIAICGAGGKSSLMFALAGEFADAGERVLMTTTTRLALEQVRGRWPGVMAADANAIAATVGTRPEPVIAYRGVDEPRGKALGYAPEVIDHLAERGPFTRILVEADGSARRPLKAPADHEPVFPARTDAVVIVAGATGLGRPL
jgi:probable selenium-dependent hydroxylase accessory protein YqeC